MLLFFLKKYVMLCLTMLVIRRYTPVINKNKHTNGERYIYVKEVEE